jgi:uncharacterized protein YkwD
LSIPLAACELPTGTLTQDGSVPVSNSGSTSQVVPGSAASLGAIVSLTNQARGSAGVAALVESASLDRAAAILCSEVAQTGVWSHTQTGTAYPTMQDRAAAVSYNWRALGENLAGTNGADPQHVVDNWMNSPDHRANILQASYTEIGVAQQQVGSLVCSVQVFGTR